MKVNEPLMAVRSGKMILNFIVCSVFVRDASRVVNSPKAGRTDASGHDRPRNGGAWSWLATAWRESERRGTRVAPEIAAARQAGACFGASRLAMTCLAGRVWPDVFGRTCLAGRVWPDVYGRTFRLTVKAL